MPLLKTSDRSPLPSSLFHYDAARRTLTAEASCLGHLVGVSYDHVDVRSDKTSTVKRFRYAYTNRDGEGDVTGWMYRSGDLTLVIYND